LSRRIFASMWFANFASSRRIHPCSPRQEKSDIDPYLRSISSRIFFNFRCLRLTWNPPRRILPRACWRARGLLAGLSRIARSARCLESAGPSPRSDQNDRFYLGLQASIPPPAGCIHFPCISPQFFGGLQGPAILSNWTLHKSLRPAHSRIL
jgi:hypothetical protein